MHELAKLFVESFRVHHLDDEVPLLVHCLDTSAEQRRELADLYPHLSIMYTDIPMRKWAAGAGVSLNRLRRWRREVEGDYVTPKNKAWKLMTAGGDRVKVVRGLVSTLTPFSPRTSVATQPAAEMLVHFDIDTLFRASILDIEQEMQGYDVGLKLRRKINPVKARITIDMMAIKHTPHTVAWLKYWTDNIDAVHPLEKPQGFGQSSCWGAFMQAEAEGMDALTLPLKYGLPGRNKPDNVVWNGNMHKLKKDDCVAYFKEELDRMKGQQ